MASLPRSTPFESAADAIVAGDIATLRDILRADPDLVHARSARPHAATLLIYISANGVEDSRQKTPSNIVDIAALLLDAGADVNATAGVYDGACATLELTATSIHPQRAGVMEPLLQLLLDRGASIDKPTLLSACLANGRPKSAEFLAARGAHINLEAAAGLGQLDTVRALFDAAAPAAKRDALFWASEYGRNPVVEFLIANEGDLAAHGADGQTALHRAIVGGQPETVNLILRHHPPLEARNTYGGTPVGQALWSAANGGDPETCIAILEALTRAGAKLPAVHSPIHPRIDAWLASAPGR